MDQWKKDESPISGATDTSYTITSASESDEGSYICEITNTVATDLTLYSRPVNLTVEATGVPSETPAVYSMSVVRGIITDNQLEIKYALPEKARVKFSIYDIRGAKVRELSEETPRFLFVKDKYERETSRCLLPQYGSK